MMPKPQECDAITRRLFLGKYAGGIGALALAHLLGAESPAAQAQDAKPPTFKPRAKSVICLFQHGGPSQVDLFDPKPALTKWHGKPYPAGYIHGLTDEFGYTAVEDVARL